MYKINKLQTHILFAFLVFGLVRCSEDTKSEKTNSQKPTWALQEPSIQRKTGEIQKFSFADSQLANLETSDALQFSNSDLKSGAAKLVVKTSCSVSGQLPTQHIYSGHFKKQYHFFLSQIFTIFATNYN